MLLEYGGVGAVVRATPNNRTQTLSVVQADLSLLSGCHYKSSPFPDTCARYWAVITSHGQVTLVHSNTSPIVGLYSMSVSGGGHQAPDKGFTLLGLHKVHFYFHSLGLPVALLGPSYISVHTSPVVLFIYQVSLPLGRRPKLPLLSFLQEESLASIPILHSILSLSLCLSLLLESLFLSLDGIG